jgi:ABC-type bacteriocin/lantibiotic exporter with double-glycine peptidase domain
MRKLIYSSAISASISIVAVTTVTIWADLAPGFKNFLASITGHHWITKSLLVVILFPLVLGLVRELCRGEISDEQAAKSLWDLLAMVIVGFVAILGFYVWHYF